MSNPPLRRVERRRTPRIRPKGTVVMSIDSLVYHARIGDLGRGGMFAHCELGSRAYWIDKSCNLELRLDGIGSWLPVVGRVIRVERHGIAFAFDAAPDDLLAVIDNIDARSLAHRRVTSVVLIDYQAARRATLGDAFRDIGCDVVEAATPLEAIVLLGECHFEPDVIAISDSHPTEGAEEIRRFVRDSHPNAKLVTIGDDALAPDGIAHWLSSTNLQGDLAQRVRAVLFWANGAT